MSGNYVLQIIGREDSPNPFNIYVLPDTMPELPDGGRVLIESFA